MGVGDADYLEGEASPYESEEHRVCRKGACLSSLQLSSLPLYPQGNESLLLFVLNLRLTLLGPLN
jgi:hypothetical protein